MIRFWKTMFYSVENLTAERPIQKMGRSHVKKKSQKRVGRPMAETPETPNNRIARTDNPKTHCPNCRAPEITNAKPHCPPGAHCTWLHCKCGTTWDTITGRHCGPIQG